MPFQRNARHLGEPIAVEPQDVDVALDKIPHVEEAPIWAEGDPLAAWRAPEINRDTT